MHGKLAAVGLAAALAATALTPPATTSAAPGQPHLYNVVQRVQSAGTFRTFVALLQRAGLASTLSGRGPYTVFAPTDAAFAALPKAQLDALANDKPALRALLLYHVVKGDVSPAELVKLRGEHTLDGGRTVTITASGTHVRINGASVLTSYARSSNGTVHVVNKVLIPQS